MSDPTNSAQNPAVMRGAESPPARAARVISATKVTARQGPIPDATELAAYEQIQPGFADRIMKTYERQIGVFERQADHRMQLERRVVGSNIWGERIGQFMAFVIAAGVCAGGIWLLGTGAGLWGFAAVLTALGALITALRAGHKKQEAQIEQKRQAVEKRKPGGR